ncbi:MAG TPA: DUF1778 domain-containing protein [Rhizomicrobium sp.]|nr:DUF1778 domain-containing protein [Rhizomicrobium sp.]
MTATASRARNATAKKDTVVNLRMPASVRDLIDDAAELAGKTRTAFIIESSRRDAMDVLLDQRLFSLDAKQYGAFLKALDEPPAPNDKLKRLMASASPWGK